MGPDIWPSHVKNVLSVERLYRYSEYNFELLVLEYRLVHSLIGDVTGGTHHHRHQTTNDT
jgi:hypothetical protein